jgi:hypothetical protein
MKGARLLGGARGRCRAGEGSGLRSATKTARQVVREACVDVALAVIFSVSVQPAAFAFAVEVQTFFGPAIG